ncbi:hypothetical protein TrVE_jg1110 [Triparma verrucosa]|uniref:Uncharacterized protein n=1 Tax=Triparma verrucosa TaxID=1606542 RepID=A0A9W7FPV1_9STRA|nr:hypothetical protein TrVE_jg1110 [Triparma verrucosa]
MKTKFLQLWLSLVFFSGLSGTVPFAMGFQTLLSPVGVYDSATRLRYTSPDDMELGGIGDDWRTFRAKLVAQERLVEKVQKVQRGKVRRARFPNFFKDAQDTEEVEEGFDFGGEGSLGGGAGLIGETWAHELTSVERGSVLLANENLGGVFMQTVVLILDVKEGGGGATGVVVNRPLQGNLREVAKRGGNVNVASGMQSAFASSRVTFGGPVKPEELAVLHSNPLATGAKEITPGVFCGGSESLRSRFRGTKALFARGHSLWVPGQLERELDRGVWYVASASSNYILRHTQGGKLADQEEDCLWSDIMKDLKSA